MIEEVNGTLILRDGISTLEIHYTGLVYMDDDYSEVKMKLTPEQMEALRNYLNESTVIVD